MQTVAETQRFISQAEKLLTASERDEVIEVVAADPLKGDLIQGTGGIRKLRFATGHKGKSGGVRVVYYYYDENVSIFMLDVFGKSEKANLSKAERNALALVAKAMKQQIKERKIV